MSNRVAATAIILSSLVGVSAATQSKAGGLEDIAKLWNFMTIAQECAISAGGTLVCSAGPMLQGQGLIAAREWASISKQYMRAEAQAACGDIAAEFLTKGLIKESIVQTFDGGTEALTCFYTNVSIKSDFRNSRRMLGAGPQFDPSSKSQQPNSLSGKELANRRIAGIYNNLRTNKEFKVCTFSKMHVSCQSASDSSTLNMYDIDALEEFYGAEFLDVESPVEICQKLNPGKKVEFVENNNPDAIKEIKICIIE